MAPVHYFQYWAEVDRDRGRGTWEIPTRHSEGSNYLFADGHAKWLKRENTYPKGPATTANNRVAYQNAINWFAYDAQERNAWRSLLGQAPE